MNSQNPNKEVSSTIGTFDGNKVIGWNPLSFAVKFIYGMRKKRESLTHTPSTRQAVAIPQLMSSMYYRKGVLLPEDYIKAAVITTPIEDQEIAREIAFDILFPQKFSAKAQTKKEAKKAKTIDPPKESYSQQTIEEVEDHDFMMDLLSEISDMGISLDTFDENDLFNNGLDEMSDLIDFINDLYSNASQGLDPQSSLVDIVNRRGGFSEIMEKGLDNLQALNDFVHKMIQKDLSSLSPADIQSSVNLGWAEEILQQSKAPWEAITASYCANQDTFSSQLNQLMANEDVSTAANSIKYLSEVGFPIDKIKELIDQLVNKKSNNLFDIQEISKIINGVPDFDMNNVLQNSLNLDPGSAFNIAKDLDQQFGTNINNELFKQWANNATNPKIDEIFQAMANLDQWQQMLSNAVKNKIDEFANSSNSSSQMSGLAQYLKDLAAQASFNSCQQALEQNATQAGGSALQTATSIEQFMNALKTMIDGKVGLDQANALEAGHRLSVPAESILEAFGGSYDLLKSMFEKGIGDFNRYMRMIGKIGSLTHAQMKELMAIAYQAGNSQAMGALGHHNLGQAFQIAEQFGSNASTQLAESLSAGPGDNLIRSWFDFRGSIPKSAKKFIRILTKNALIKIAMNFAASQRGTGEKGLLPSNKLRPYIDGDDMDLIDIDASIENIVMAGKSPEMISVDDLLVSDTERGRVALCFLLDVSGSMTGMKLASCSIAVVSLIGRLLPEEVAISLFESGTHVIKTFDDQKDIDSVADQLLDLEGMGGTQVQAALEWGADQLKLSDSEMKICFLLTDCEFSESDSVVRKELDPYIQERTKFILAVNTRSYDHGTAEMILKATRGKMLKIIKIEEIPKLISETLEKIV